MSKGTASLTLTLLKGARHCMDGGIKLLSSFVIRILCNICKGKISTFVVLEGGKARLSFPWFPVTTVGGSCII